MKIISEEKFINAVTAAFNDFKENVPTENVAVNANEDNNGDELKKESTMEELEKQECGTPAPVTAAESVEEKPIEAQAAKEDEGADKKDEPKAEKEEAKKEEKAEGEDKKEDKPEAKGDGLPKAKVDELKDLVAELDASEKAEQAAGEDEAKDIEILKKIKDLLGMKDKKEEIPAPEAVEAPAVPEIPAPEAVEAPAAEEPAPLFGEASLVASFEKKATIADSVWMIKNAKDNSDFLSFNVKAAFGSNIDNDEARSTYATSEEFGKAVVAALINEKVASAVGAKAAVLGVVAHYSPAHASAHKYQDFAAANPGAVGEKVEKETDKQLPAAAKEAKAAVEAPIAKTAATEGVATEALATDATILPDAVKVAEAENNKQDKSAHAYQGPKIPADADKKVIASMEETIKKQAEEINALKLQATINEKAAKVKEAVNLMVRAGLIKTNEQVRIAALKEGLSIEAANAKGMAASIDAQSKDLFGMNTPQLDSYIKSLAALAPRAKVVQAESLQPLNVKASTIESETERLAKILGWE